MAARSTDYNKSDAEPYLVRQVFITRTKNEKEISMWYVDSCTLKHIYNNKK